jgi:DNA-directed RNA polymerase subunit K/omega
MTDFLTIEYVDNSEGGGTFEDSIKLGDPSDTKPKVTDAMLTQYEYSALLSTRARQIATGSPIKVKWNNPFNPIEIAKLEIEQRVVPLTIIRKIPDSNESLGYYEEKWNIRELDIRDF